MHFKVFEIKDNEKCKQVAIGIGRDDEDNNDFVEITAWHKEEDNWFFQYEVVGTGLEMYLLLRIVADFSQESANEFVKNFNS